MKNIKQLFNILSQWKAAYFGASMLLVLTSWLRILEPKVMQVAIDAVIGVTQSIDKNVTKSTDFFTTLFQQLLPTPSLQNITWLLSLAMLLYVFLSILKSATLFWGGQIAASSTEKAIDKLRNTAFTHILALPMNRSDKISTAEMIQRCTGDIGTVREFIGTQATEVFRLVALFLSAFGMMLVVHVPYALISVAVIPIIAVTSYLFFQKEGDVWEAHEKEQDKLTAIIQENLNGIRVVQAFAKENIEILKFEKQNKEKLRIALRHVSLHQWFWSISDFVIGLQVAVSMLAGAYFTLRQEITIGEFASFFTYAVIVTSPMRNLGRLVTQMGMAAIAVQRLSEVMDLTKEDFSGWSTTEPLRGDIEFKNVTFSYRLGEKIVLDNLSFNIKSGEKIAFLGEAGSGKSTIIALLARLYEPQSGVIFLDGRPLSDYSKSFLRSRLGIISQKPFLFSTSIQNNISFINDTATDSEIKIAALSAAVADFAEKMPKGYDTLIGEKGVTLSGGQKQRVALARTLLTHSDILFLDDATSAVDTETETHIWESLKQKIEQKTTFIIAHRLSSIQQADRIFVIKKGVVTESGTPAELLAQDGFYRKIYDLQMSVEAEIAADIKNW